MKKSFVLLTILLVTVYSNAQITHRHYGQSGIGTWFNNITYAPNGNLLAAGGFFDPDFQGLVAVIDTATGNIIRSAEINSHVRSECMKVVDDGAGNLFAIGWNSVEPDGNVWFKDPNVCLTRLDAAMNTTYSRTYGIANPVFPNYQYERANNGIFCNGSIVMCGYIQQWDTFSSGISANPCFKYGSDILVHKVNAATGVVTWSIGYDVFGNVVRNYDGAGRLGNLLNKDLNVVDKTDEAWAIVQSGNRYYVAGSATFDQFSNPTENTEFFLMCLDTTNGGVIWAKTYGNPGHNHCKGMTSTSDGGFILAGYSGDQTGNDSLLLVKVDVNGALQWARTYDGLYSSGMGMAWGITVVQASDGGYAVSAETNQFSANGQNKGFVLKTDASGSFTWANAYGSKTGAGGDGFFGLLPTNNGFIAAGWSEAIVTGSTMDAVLVRIRTNGTTALSCLETTAASSAQTPSINVYSVPLHDILIKWGALETNPAFTNNSPGLNSQNNICLSLPVELLDFQATSVNNSVQLTWATSSEINNSHFIVEKSLDGKSWEYVGSVAGSGSASSENNYSLVDAKPLEGVSYYRLGQVDYDGTVTWYEPVSVRLTSDKFILGQLYPQPANGVLNLNLASTVDGHATLIVNDMLGRQIVKKGLALFSGANTVQVETKNLASGKYLLEIISDEGVQKIQRVFVVAPEN